MDRTGMQIRAHFPVQVRANENGSLPTLSGHAALFDVETEIRTMWGTWTESIARGAFAESLRRSDDVRCLFNHDPSLIVARTPNTLTLKEDERGLFCEFTPSNTQIGRDLVEMISRGDVTQMSFGFIIEKEKEDYTREKPHFTILQARLFDVSPVTYPAYEETEISVVRSLPDDKEIQRRLKQIEMHRSDPSAEVSYRLRDLEISEIGE